MKYIFIVVTILVTVNLSAETSISHDSKTVATLLNTFFVGQNKSIKPVFKQGDFNGDGGKRYCCVIYTEI